MVTSFYLFYFSASYIEGIGDPQVDIIRSEAIGNLYYRSIGVIGADNIALLHGIGASVFHVQGLDSQLEPIGGEKFDFIGNAVDIEGPLIAVNGSLDLGGGLLVRGLVILARFLIAGGVCGLRQFLGGIEVLDRLRPDFQDLSVWQTVRSDGEKVSGVKFPNGDLKDGNDL